MNKNTIGNTTLEQFPRDFQVVKRQTNRVWTFLMIVAITLLCAAFWLYRERSIAEHPPAVTPVTAPSSEQTMDSLGDTLSEMEIPAFHEAL